MLADGEGERLSLGDAEIIVKVDGEATGGAFAIFEEVEPFDTPLHVHEHEDELFWVTEGEHVFRVGDEEYPAGPGAVVFAPRRIPHAHRRVVPRTGRFLGLVSPAGFEGFFRDLDRAAREGTLGPDAYAAASERFGITWLGDG
jgi:mannose-6-phosphate isomerase-like protein (cupin superfamily)